MEAERSPCEQQQLQQHTDTWERLVDEVMLIVLKREKMADFTAKLCMITKRLTWIAKIDLFRLWSPWTDDDPEDSVPIALNFYPKGSPGHNFILKLWEEFKDEEKRKRMQQSNMLLPVSS